MRHVVEEVAERTINHKAVEHNYVNCSHLMPGDRVAVRINNPYRRDTGILVELVDVPTRCSDNSGEFHHTFPCCDPKWWVRFENPDMEVIVHERDMKFVNWFGRFLNWVQYL